MIEIAVKKLSRKESRIIALRAVRVLLILFLNQTVDKVYSLIVAVHSTAAAAKPQQESRSILIPVKIADFDSRPMGGNQPIDFLSIG